MNEGPNLGFEILHEEGPCWVINKPGGLLTQAPPHIDSVEKRVKAFIKERDNKPGRVYLGVPHRIDRPVSGALVLARHVRAARRICEQFAGRIVEKKYWALVEGRIAEDEGVWRDYVRKVPNEARAEVVAEGEQNAREAVLKFKVVQHFEQATWLEIELETGRMHQIRIQSAARGRPILGDSQYGATTPFGPTTDDRRARWIGLHARSLAFRHPMTREPLHVEAPLPRYWQDFNAECFGGLQAAATEQPGEIAPTKGA